MSRGYDMETARRIFGEIERRMRRTRFSYSIGFEPFTMSGGRYVRVKVIDTTTSRPTEPYGVRWRITDEALTRALRTLLEAPLIGPPSLGHRGDRVCGRPIQVKGDGSAEVIYEIVDPEAWSRIKSGEWRAVSPQVLAEGERGDDGAVQVTDCIFEHVALVPEGAFPDAQIMSVYEGPLENFGFAYSLSAALCHGHFLESGRTARDDDAMGTRFKTPNQPQVPEKERGERGEIMSLRGAEFNPTADWPDSCFAYVPPSAQGSEGNKSERKLPYRWPDGRIDLDHLRNALARWSQTEFHSQEAKMDALRELCRAAREAGVESDLCEERLSSGMGDSSMVEEKDRRIAELEAEVKRLQSELAASRQRMEILERKEPHKTFQAELERLKAENKELKEWKSKVIAEELAERASEVEDLRIRAGLSDERDRSKNIEQLKLLNAEALERMRDDLLAVVTMIESEPAGPKARFRVPRSDSIVEQVRATLYGYTRDEKGEVE
jgi:hypothetical protein